MGMLAGAILYAFSFDWVRDNILSVWKLGKVTLPGLMGASPLAVYIGLALFAAAFFYVIEKMRIEKRAN
jgi:hypothetical protein